MSIDKQKDPLPPIVRTSQVASSSNYQFNQIASNKQTTNTEQDNKIGHHESLDTNQENTNNNENELDVNIEILKIMIENNIPFKMLRNQLFIDFVKTKFPMTIWRLLTPRSLLTKYLPILANNSTNLFWNDIINCNNSSLYKLNLSIDYIQRTETMSLVSVVCTKFDGSRNLIFICESQMNFGNNDLIKIPPNQINSITFNSPYARNAASRLIKHEQYNHIIRFTYGSFDEWLNETRQLIMSQRYIRNLIETASLMLREIYRQPLLIEQLKDVARRDGHLLKQLEYHIVPTSEFRLLKLVISLRPFVAHLIWNRENQERTTTTRTIKPTTPTTRNPRMLPLRESCEFGQYISDFKSVILIREMIDLVRFMFPLEKCMRLSRDPTITIGEAVKYLLIFVNHIIRYSHRSHLYRNAEPIINQQFCVDKLGRFAFGIILACNYFDRRHKVEGIGFIGDPWLKLAMYNLATRTLNLPNYSPAKLDQEIKDYKEKKGSLGLSLDINQSGYDWWQRQPDTMCLKYLCLRLASLKCYRTNLDETFGKLKQMLDIDYVGLDLDIIQKLINAKFAL